MQLAIEIVKPSVKLITPIEWLAGMTSIIEYCGRLSHKTGDKQTEESAERFLRRWAVNSKPETERHESILEHSAITMHFVMSRTASHQLVRHRLCAFTQESQRYCDYSKPKFGQTLQVICPPSVAEVVPGTMVVAELRPTLNPATWDDNSPDYTYKLVAPDVLAAAERLINVEPFRRWAFAILRAYGRYLWLRDERVPAEDARFVLPNAAKTEIAMTANVRQWRHVFRLRCDKHAQWEIRGLMKQALALLIESMPICFGDEEMLELVQ